MIFAVLLMALTLGINVVLPKADADTAADTTHKVQPVQPDATAQVAHSAQVN